MASKQTKSRTQPLISVSVLRMIIPILLLLALLVLALAVFYRGAFSWPLLLVALIALLAAMALGLIWARQTDQRLKNIVTAAERVAAGDFLVRIEDPYHDEISHFAQVFNQMATNLEQLNRNTNLLRRTMSPAVRQWIAERGLDFRGITQVVSILFIDIRGFTNITENYNTEKVVFFLNDFFTTVANQVHIGGGIIGKYGGDSILAFFGAPEPEPRTKSSTAALLTGLALQDAMEEMSQRWTILGLPPIRAGIGLSMGEVVAGPIGSEEQFEYTVIGDAVNLASRLQDLTRTIDGFHTILSEDVYLALEDKIKMQIPIVSLERYQTMTEEQRRRNLFQLVDFGEVLVKGKRGPVRVYGLHD